MGNYIDVQQGDHVSRIASKHGFADYRTIWNRAENSELKQKRKNPNILVPGDKIFLPEWDDKTESGSTDQRHVFQLQTQPLMLRIVIRNVDDQPMKNTLCELEVEHEVYQLTTNEKGMIEHPIPKDAEHGTLKVMGADGRLMLQFTLLIGHLHPIDVESGERARLNNMGYFAGYSSADEKQLKWAVEEFQCENGVKPVDGNYDAKTQGKLEKAHGC